MTTLPAPIATFIAATNAGDSDAFVANFTEDGSLNDWGRVVHGHAGVREWDRTDNIGKHSQFELVEFTEEAAERTYLVQLKVSGQGFNGVSPFRFTLRDGLVESVVIVAD